MRTLSYLLRESWVNMRTNRTTTMVAILTTAFTLACVGVFLLLYVNLRAAAGWLQRARPKKISAVTGRKPKMNSTELKSMW